MARKAVTLVVVMSLVVVAASSVLAYAVGFRAAQVEYERQSLIMYANLLGEQLIEMNRLASTIESPELQDYMQQEMKSFVIVVGCGKWYDKLASVDRKDLPEFSKALDFAKAALSEDSNDHIDECLDKMQ